jgi:predicted enzyme related to lactoylglutathione lyase
MARELRQAHLEAIRRLAAGALAALDHGDQRETARLAMAAGRLCEEIAGRWTPAAVEVMARLGGKDVAAISAPPPQMGGMPPFWMSYVSVEDADAATAKARELDANLISEPFDVFDSGRMAVIQDPQGAVFAVRQPKQHIGASLVNAPGAFIWNQGSFPDPEAAKRFYGDLFGWTFVESSEFEEPNAAIRNSDKTNGGLSGLPAPEVPPNWGVSFTVEDLDAAADKVRSSGGQVLVGPEPMGRIGRFLVAVDPQGGTFGLYEGEVDP